MFLAFISIMFLAQTSGGHNQRVKPQQPRNIDFTNDDDQFDNKKSFRSEYLDGSLSHSSSNITSKKIRQEEWDFTHKRQRQSLYDERFSEFLSGRNTQTYQRCPIAEMYIGYITRSRYDQFKINDIEIRRKDRTQFVTGTYSVSSSGALPRADQVDSCFIARISTRGDFEKAVLLSQVNAGDHSYCNNLALIPRINFLVAVGYARTNTITSKAMIILTDQTSFNLNQKAIKFWTRTNDAYTGTIESEATDVQVSEADGSIFITGFIKNSFSRGASSTTQNCFIIKVDTEINLIYAKSFGDKLTQSVLECRSLQLTRNVDYIYFGGYITYSGLKRLFFSKSNGDGDFMVTTAVAPLLVSDQFILKRILIDRGNSFSSTNEQLYFCGTLTTTDSNFMYGYINSGDVETYQNDTIAPFQSTLISVQRIFSYGTSGNEYNSDCALSDDNKHLMVVFQTNYHKTYAPYTDRIWVGKTAPQDTVQYKDTEAIPNIRGTAATGAWPSFAYSSNHDPFGLSSSCGPWCNIYDTSSAYSYAQMQQYFLPDNAGLSATPTTNTQTIRNDCEDPIQKSISYYTNIYSNQMYSWHQCTQNYWWEFDSIKNCQIYSLDIAACPGTVPGGQWRTLGACPCGGCGGCCAGSSCSDGMECNRENQANNRRPWYSDTCFAQEQRRNIYLKSLDSDRFIQQYMFCYDSDPTPSTCTEDDKIFMIFEQDCLESITSTYDSIFVARFALDFTSATYINDNPQIAAYIGDISGNVESHSIALDQYGFVYIHGSGKGNGFGAADPSPLSTEHQRTWLHLKTHWDLAGEFEFNPANEKLNAPAGKVDYKEQDETNGFTTFDWNGRSSDFAGERPPSFMGKKFTVPKKFKNDHPLSTNQVTFLSTYAITSTNPQAKAYLVNEEFFKTPHTLPQSLSEIVCSSSSTCTSPFCCFIWGYSYAKASKVSDVQIFVDSNTLSTEELTFNVPHICVSSIYSSYTNWAHNFYREQILGKKAVKVMTATTSAQFSLDQSGLASFNAFTNYGSSNIIRESVELSIKVINPNLIPEGRYYFDVRVYTEDDRPWYSGNDPYSTYPPTNKKQCISDHHGFFYQTDRWNEGSLPDGKPNTFMRRFETSYRVKILVDQVATSEPTNIKNIPDISPIIGQRYEIQLSVESPATIFTSKYFSGCDRYYAKQQKQTVSIPPSFSISYQTEALPHWIKFHERNHTFQIYPIIESPHRIISIEVSCCNSIEQCATQTFHVDAKNTPPVSDFAQTNTYVVQYDDLDKIGQQFQWEMRNTYFYDVDIANDVKDVANKRTDHTVDMDFTDTITTFSNQFRHIKRLGLIFGQGMNTIYGIKLLNYKFRDNFVTTTQQLGYLKVLINRMPTVTPVGSSYKITQIDPIQFGGTSYFDKWFPFLDNDDLLVFEVDSSPWFTDDATDILTYGLTRSDNTERPSWIEFDVINGKMTGFPNKTEQSELVQLKFTVQDQQQGTNKVYKEMLINTKPRARNMYKVIEVGINRQFAINISEMIWDYNNDPITFSLPQSADQSKLTAYGISFNDATKLIYGKPTLQGTIALIKLRGTDTHGSYTDVYLTIKIDDYQPNKRGNLKYPDRKVYEYQRFEFQLDDSLFYDQKDYGTLVYFAYDPAEIPLPSWLHFMPQTRTFNGVAPKRNTEQVVVIRAMNTITHDSLSVTFRIQVVENPSPRTKMAHIPDDLTIVQNTWIDHQLPILMFQDKNNNYMPIMEILPVNGNKLPSFLKFNQVNRTLYGKANETGSFRVDFMFSDDQGRKTFSNIRITVTPADYSLPQKYYYHFGIAISAFLSLLIFLGFAFHTNSLLNENFQLADTTEKDAQEARNRFGGYREIDVRFKKPQIHPLDQVRQARLRHIIKMVGGEAGAISARTYDYNFSVAGNQQEHNQFQETMSSMLNKTNEKLFKGRQEDEGPFKTLTQRKSLQNTQIRKIGQKTKVFSM